MTLGIKFAQTEKCSSSNAVPANENQKTSRSESKENSRGFLSTNRFAESLMMKKCRLLLCVGRKLFFDLDGEQKIDAR